MNGSDNGKHKQRCVRCASIQGCSLLEVTGPRKKTEDFYVCLRCQPAVEILIGNIDVTGCVAEWAVRLLRRWKAHSELVSEVRQ